MEDSAAARRQVVEAMQKVVEFALETYGLTHTGTITINISHSTTGLFTRYEEVFGEKLEALPDECSFQEGQHMFFSPQCRSDKLPLASEWFLRATGVGRGEPAMDRARRS